MIVMIGSVLSNDARNLTGNILECARSPNQRTVTPHPNYTRRSQVFDLENRLTNKCSI